jgi:hypothetical protein
MPWKTWAFLEQVSSAQFQDYLQNQTVNRFTTAAQRDTQILTPVVGQTCQLSTTGEVLVYYGPGVGWKPPWNTAWGMVAAPKILAAPATNITTIIDLSGMSITWNALTGRHYEVGFSGCGHSSVGGDFYSLVIADQANVLKFQRHVYTVTNALGAFIHGSFIESPIQGPVTRKLRAQRASGTGLVSIFGAAAEPTTLWVRDIGSAAVPTVLRSGGEDEDLELLPAPETPETKD